MSLLPFRLESARRDSGERAHCVDVAMRRRPADLVIEGGNLLSVRSGEILPGWGVAVAGRRIAAIGDVRDCIGPATRTLAARGMTLLPGFCDGHLHIESSYLAPASFARAALPAGTTSVMEDPHEIANVLGLGGIRYFLEAGRDLPMKIWPQVSSAVPPSSLETSGGSIGPEEALEALGWPGVVGIGEVMTPWEVVRNDPRIRGIIDAALAGRHPVEGHAARLGVREVDAYASAGIGSDHEARPEDYQDKLRRGLAIQIRVGGWWARTFKAMIGAALRDRLDTRALMLVTDDRPATELLSLGAMDYNVRCAIEEGVPPVQAVQMATINVAVHFGLAQEIGEIAPGRLADILLVRDLKQVRVAVTIASGRLVAEDGVLTTDLPDPGVPDHTRDTVVLPRRVQAGDFVIRAPGPGPTVTVRLPSFSRPAGAAELPVKGGIVQADPASGITKIAVIERHTGRGGSGLGFARGLGPMRGAVATTVAHDAHNLVVAGADDAAMALAANRAAELGGGIVVVEGDQVRAELPLPIAGLMSPQPPAEVAGALEALNAAARDLGTGDWMGSAPIPIFTFLTLTAAHPQLITDLGFVDVEQQQVVSLFV